ncbi:MAG: 60 kDa chaperonin 5 [Chlamydiae bacterium]|nr:60 kDa chaperonin 5 [Chlamydiota bacterium]
MSEAKEIIFEQEAREKLAGGIKQLANAVRATLGPKGRNVGLERGWGAPTITNDGNSIVKDVELADQYEQMGVAMAQEVAAKIKEKCGDGTTTGTLLLDALVEHGIKYIAAGASPIGIKRGIEKATTALLNELENNAIPVKGKEDTQNIATVSASGNSEIGTFIAEAIEKVGREGVVTIEEAKGTETVIETVEGMQFDRGYISPYFATNQEKMRVEMENPSILLVEKKITSIQELLPILQSVASTGRELLLISEDVEADALATLVVNKIRGTLKVAAVKAPGFGDNRKAMLEDLAVLTGATLISEDAGVVLKDAQAEVLGSAERVIVTKDTTTIVGGKGEHKAIGTRIAQLETQAEKSTSSYDKEKLIERKAKLKGGVAVIRVGAATEPELKAKKQMFEDSLNSTKAALEEGIVAGGGIALFHAGKILNTLSLEGDEALGAKLVEKALEAPTRQIVSNTGFDGSVIVEQLRDADEKVGFNALTEKVEDLIAAGVLDPVKVVKNCLIFSTSVAGVILISEALIGDAPEEEE